MGGMAMETYARAMCKREGRDTRDVQQWRGVHVAGGDVHLKVLPVESHDRV